MKKNCFSKYPLVQSKSAEQNCADYSQEYFKIISRLISLPAVIQLTWFRHGSALLLFFFCSFLVTIAHAQSLIPIKVSKGANLISLTRKFCTSENHWKELAKINGLKDPNLILPGEVLYVPFELLKAEKLSAKVASVIGGVYLVRNGEKLKRISKGDLILPGQTLVTENDGFTHLVFPDNKYTRIASDSKFTLTYIVRLVDESLKAEFFLEKGRITHSVKERLKENETYTTRTPVSVTGVRGTEFRMKVGEDSTNIVETLVGLVKVDGSGRSLSVRTGEGTKVKPGKPPEPSRKLPPPPDSLAIGTIFQELPVLIKAPDKQGSELVKEYRFRVARDLNGLETVAEHTAGPGSDFSFITLEDGTYYGFLTAINQDNFESTAKEPTEFRVRTVPGPPVFSSRLNGQRTFKKSIEKKWLKIELAENYRVQVATDREFEKVIAEKVQSAAQYTTEELAPGRYFIRVQAIADDGFTSLFSLVDTWQIEKEPALDNISGSLEDGVALNWANMGENITYDIQIAGDKNFKNLVVNEANIFTASYTLKDNLEPGTYYVRLRGVLSDGQASPWTPPQELIIKSPPFGWIDASILLTFLAVVLII